LRIDVREARVEVRVLERHRTDRAFALRVADVVVRVPEPGEPQSFGDRNTRNRAERRLDLERLLIVRSGFLVPLAAVDADVEVAEVGGESDGSGRAGVGRREKA